MHAAIATSMSGIVISLLLALLTGCAGHQLHREGMALIAQGRAEEGLAKLAQASSADPDNVSYQTDFLRSRNLAVSRLLAAADSERAADRPAAARAIYERILAIHPGNSRAVFGLEMLDMDARHEAALTSADALLKKRDTDAARAALAPVLLESPRNGKALLLQRKINEQVAKEALPEPSLKAKFTKPVTLQFRDANLNMVFEALSRTSGINVLLDRDVKADLKTSIFVRDVSVEDTINLILLQNQMEKKVISDNTVFIYPATAAKLKEYQDLKIRSFHLANADPKQMLTMVKTLLKTKDVFIHEKTNSIVMRDTPDAIRLAEKMIADQDIDQPEVMLEVEVLEVSTSRLSELGIRWPSSFGLATPPEASTLGQLRALGRNDLLATPLSATLNLALEDGDTNVLASPRIRVRNREKAKIMIGSRVPVITNAVTPLSTGTPVITGSVQYLDVGLKLDVEPDINLDNEVVIKVALDVSSIIKEVLNAQSGSLAYEIGTRNATTVLRLKDGETQILAGLINDEERKTATKVPGLGQLPVIGRLFSSHRDNGSKTEIVLSITPRIVARDRLPDISEVEYWSGTESSLRNGTLSMNPMGTVSLASGSTAPPIAAVAPLPGRSTRRGAQSPAPAASAPAIQAPAASTDTAAPPPAVTAPPAPARAAPVALTWQGPAQVKPGDKVNLTLNVNSEQALNRLDLLVTFNPEVFRSVDVVEGAFLRQTNAPLILSKAVDQASGQIQLGVTGSSPDGASGTGTLVTLVFEAIATTPNSQIIVGRLAPTGPGGAALTATAPEPYVVRVIP
ncbi:cohesin domain-containing protein [Variovorax sp. LjRoot175]|uniref:secretin N-terminal domain-containing protein n=2 Tax=unclassified Variovorax TaxID=663243 RepID=UPI003ECFD73F